MDQFDAPIGHKRTGVFVVILVLLGLGGVSAGGYMVWRKKNGGSTSVDSKEVEAWCKLRQEWKRKVQPLAGDIMLKSVKSEDHEALKALIEKRNQTCQDYARKIRELNITNDNLKKIEVALVKEGKTRANVSVEIDNAIAKLSEMQIPDLNKQQTKLTTYIKKRVKNAKDMADAEIKAAMGALGSSACTGIFHGPMTDQGTSGNPYMSWDEIEIQRTQALKQINDQIKNLEPVVQFTNRVYHELIRRYRPTLKKCYKKAKRANPKMSDKLGLRIRLKRNGGVSSLGIEWMINREEKILDCLLQTAARWKLPIPTQDIDYIVITLDFNTI